MRPMLRPGLQVLRRDAQTIQFGLDWPGVAALRETPALRAVLSQADGFKDTDGVVLAAADNDVAAQQARDALHLLIDCGILVDQAAYRRDGVDEQTWASLWLLAGPTRTADEVLAAQRDRSVQVCGSGRAAQAVRRVLSQAAMQMADDDADLMLIASDVEHDRALADQAMRDGRPHLWVGVRDLVGVIGPLVQPGRTACIRCVDAAYTDRDRAWSTLVESAAVHRRQAAACDPTVAALVGAWAAQEVVAWASGVRPQTSGAVVEVPMGFGDVQRHEFDLHPKCGCGWPVLYETMGA